MTAGEREIVQRLRRRAPSHSATLIEGIGDDCAVYRPRAGQDLVFTTDFLIENVHFRRATHSAADIGYRALARGLSDLAAMGAKPRFCLLSLAVPEWASTRFIDGLFAGLLRLGEQTRCPLAGGDLSRAPVLVCDIVAAGSVPRGKALRRDRARPGDAIWVSGALGRGRRRFCPRLSLGRALLGRASAAIDLSDGLSIDLARLCEASGCSAHIVTPPIARGATLHDALHAGEDYELLFTAPVDSQFPKVLAGIRLTQIGYIARGKPGKVFLNGDPLHALGYDHFRQPS